MTIFWSDAQLRHSNAHFVQMGAIRPSRESASRAALIAGTLRARGKVLSAPDDAGCDPILAVHDADYVDFLRCAWGRWVAEYGNGAPLAAGGHAMPNAFPLVPYAQKPDLIVGQLGWYSGDMAAEIVEGTWAASYWSAQGAIAAARAVRITGRAHYALCRPPGHHALAGKAMGFCYLNNAAIAAEELRGNYAKVAILDVDVHHGNGTQAIFYDRADVLTVSMHSHPRAYYPFFTGYPEERGEGEGEGFNLNTPYEFGAGDGPFLSALERSIKAIVDFAPDALVLALGVDASEHDTHGRHAVTRPAFGAMAERISALGLPTVIVQEGGYESDVLGHLIADVLDVFGV
ncbi:histone deacetylase family protein [Roseovarius sp. Pro17]|uniref:histone deacetylase family protein n=1 Tax=Roseovarius sp. Pro17 TaxID=3108175 RepID=UPI002D773E91|nr:histone deacetylase family protein [Roseovarius sp. Pro17]